jgi:HrpA-like RNA helicase
MGTSIGKKVGYSVRFDEKVSNETKIKYVTDGMLLRESILDRKLQKYSVIILDEVHERSLNSDTILALAKDLIINKHRNDLKLIVMSATLSVDKFSRYLNTNNAIFIDGRSYPIEIYNTLITHKSYLVNID